MNVQVLSKHPMWVIVRAILLIALATGCSRKTRRPQIRLRRPSRWSRSSKRMFRFIANGSARWTAWLTPISKPRSPAIFRSRITRKARSSGKGSCYSKSIRGRSRRWWIRPRANCTGERTSAQAKAQLTQAEAQVAVAEANQRRTQLDVDRYIPLAEQQAITQQDLDNATQNNLAAKAQVQAAKAQVETARAQIQAAVPRSRRLRPRGNRQAQSRLHPAHSPIDGIAGIAQQQVGALVSPASGAVTTVSTRRSDQGLLHRQRAGVSRLPPAVPNADQPEAEPNSCELELILADGTIYPANGEFLFRGSPSGSGHRLDSRGRALSRTRETCCAPGNTRKVRTSITNQAGALCWFRSAR